MLQFDAIESKETQTELPCENSTMYGFLDGPHGVFAGNFVVITDEIMDGFRNTGAAPGICWAFALYISLHIKVR